MTFTVLHEEPITRKYRASKCSCAYICKSFIAIIVFILPLIICFASQGFWKKTNTYWEQPGLMFKNRYIFVVRCDDTDKYFVHSSYPVINLAESSRLKIPIFEMIPSDRNDDRLPDEIKILVRFPVESDDRITGILWMLLFDFRLQLRSVLSTEVLLFGDESSVHPATGLNVYGDLFLEQSYPLPHAGRFPNYGGSIINESVLSAPYYGPENILKRLSQRNQTATLKRKFQQWISKPVNNGYFTFSLDIAIPEQEFVYRTGAFELLKWAWIQYFSIFVIFYIIARKILSFFFVNRIFDLYVAKSD
ncbi:hypothetical protein AB6A40_009441 [Gnathostoma spinigerum]|uniref:Transmembrane protein 231 n=1 Tax=Gnathostoma spinigerum TaxID=75299 RepID=A0ABD6F0U1_9BILA